jgi:hypothetical protein
LSAALEDVRTELNARCDAIEECYEYMLAYAAQGVVTEGPQIRGFLQRCDQAIADLIDLSTKFAGALKTAAAPYAAFMTVVESDARASQAAVRLALAQTVIMSQLVDNLNASIHLRALLTDLFLLDEALK